MSEKKENDLTDLTGLWIKEAKSGTKYLTAVVKSDMIIPAGSVLMAFKVNKEGMKSNAPDYSLCFKPLGEKKQDG